MSLHTRLRSLSRRLLVWYAFAKRLANKKRRPPAPTVPLTTRLKLCWNGFYPDKYER